MDLSKPIFVYTLNTNGMSIQMANETLSHANDYLKCEIEATIITRGVSNEDGSGTDLKCIWRGTELEYINSDVEDFNLESVIIDDFIASEQFNDDELGKIKMVLRKGKLKHLLNGKGM